LARLFLAKAFLPDYPGLEKQVQALFLPRSTNSASTPTPGCTRLRPELQAAARTADDLLFAKFSDGDLTRLGVDAAALPIVRSAATADGRPG